MKLAEDRALHEAKLAKMETEMKMVFQQKVAEKEAKLKQSEEELYARHREMKDALEKQRADLEDKKRRIESGRPLTPDKTVRISHPFYTPNANILIAEKALSFPRRKVEMEPRGLPLVSLYIPLPVVLLRKYVLHTTIFAAVATLQLAYVPSPYLVFLCHSPSSSSLPRYPRVLDSVDSCVF